MGKKTLVALAKASANAEYRSKFQWLYLTPKICHPFYDFIEHILAVINIEIYDSSGNSPLCE